MAIVILHGILAAPETGIACDHARGTACLFEPYVRALLRDRAAADSDDDVRSAALQAIATGWPDDPRTLPLLRDRAATDSDDDVREAALQIIAASWPDDPRTMEPQC